jgi:hypothetical protein
MKIGFHNFHYDMLKQFGYIFDKLGWEAFILASPEFDFFWL